MGFWEESNWFYLLSAWAVVVLPAALLLILISIHLRKEKTLLVERVAEAGLLVAALTIVLPLIWVFWDFYGYYKEMGGAALHIDFGDFKFPRIPLPPGWY